MINELKFIFNKLVRIWIFEQVFFQVPKLIPLDLPGALSWWNKPEDEHRTSLHLPPYQFSRLELFS